MSEIKSRRNFDHRQAKIEIVYDDKYRKVIQCDRGIAAIIKALNENEILQKDRTTKCNVLFLQKERRHLKRV